MLRKDILPSSLTVSCAAGRKKSPRQHLCRRGDLATCVAIATFVASKGEDKYFNFIICT